MNTDTFSTEVHSGTDALTVTTGSGMCFGTNWASCFSADAKPVLVPGSWDVVLPIVLFFVFGVAVGFVAGLVYGEKR